MATFNYRAITNDGRIVKNKVEEGNRISLIHKLKQNGLHPITVSQIGAKKNRNIKKKRNVSNVNSTIEKISATVSITDNRRKLTVKDKLNNYLGTSDKITERDISIFTQNFYLLKKANFNNVHALSTIIDSTENLTFAGILEDILAGVEAGDYMYKTMEYYSYIFPYIYINMIKVGEQSGSLVNSLEQALKYLEDTRKLRKKLYGILIPNIVQFALLIVLLFVGTLYAIPAIQGVFQELGTSATLPAITLWFQAVVNNLIRYWYIPTSIIITVVGALLFYINTPKGKYNFHYFKYNMPIFGRLIYKLDFSRLIKAMNLNLQNGMRIQDALDVSKNVVKNYIMLSMVETAINNTLIGTSWVEPFERASFSSSMQTEMLKIGMQTDLSEMMAKLVEYMDIEIDNEINRIMKILPEVVYTIVGVVLIFFVLVVLVPCVQVYMGNWLFDAYL